MTYTESVRDPEYAARVRREAEKAGVHDAAYVMWALEHGTRSLRRRMNESESESEAIYNTRTSPILRRLRQRERLRAKLEERKAAPGSQPAVARPTCGWERSY
jgi:hypothetical protein